MKIQNTSVLAIVILLAIVSTILFAAPGNISNLCMGIYIITIIVFIGAIILNYQIFSQSLRSVFYKTSLLIVGNSSIAAQTTFLFVTRYMPDMKIWVAVILETLIIGIYVIIFLSLISSTKATNDVEVSVSPKRRFIQQLCTEVSMLSFSEHNVDNKKLLEELSLQIKYSDPMSDSSLFEVEQSIIQMVKGLSDVQSNELPSRIKEIAGLLQKRNRQCKILK